MQAGKKSSSFTKTRVYKQPHRSVYAQPDIVRSREVEKERRTITHTAKFKILPDKTEQRELYETMCAYRDGCRYAAEYIHEKQELRRIHLHKELYPVLRARDKYGLPSQMAESVIKTAVSRTKALIQVYRSWVKPEFHTPACELVHGRDYTIWEEYLSIRTLEKRLKVPFVKKGMEQYLSGEWKPGTARLIRKGSRWYLHIPMTKEKEIPEIKPETCVVGCDFGINFLVTAYDSNGRTTFYSGREVKKRRAEYERVMEELKQKHTKSAKRRMKELRTRENGYLSDMNHRKAKALVNIYPAGTVFAVEELNHGKAGSEPVMTGKGLVEVTGLFADLREKIAYRAVERGGRVLEAEPAFTSKKCPKCGSVRKGNRDKKKHTYKCERCGYESNDDRIGAMNLYIKGLEVLAEESPAILGSEEPHQVIGEYQPTKMCEEPHQVYRQQMA